MEYSREQLVSICERGVVPQSRWTNRDTAETQKQLGQAWVWLKAGCKFKVRTKTEFPTDSCVTDDETIWIDVWAEGFAFHDYEGELDEKMFYLPTEKRLKDNEGRDWY